MFEIKWKYAEGYETKSLLVDTAKERDEAMKRIEDVGCILISANSIPSKYKIRYVIEGEIEVEAKDVAQAYQHFENRVGFSNDDIFENLNNNPKIIKINGIDFNKEYSYSDDWHYSIADSKTRQDW